MLAVLGALFANGIITVLNFIAAVMAGSSGMMAESLHSLADTTNQVFLLLGLTFYKRPASDKHPFGYGKRASSGRSSPRYSFSESARLMRLTKESQSSGIRIFRNLEWAYWVLAISFVLEAGSIGLAVYQEVKEAHHEV
ncbi:MAG: cation transporter [Pyrinomonadaceae bacterium]